MKEIPVNDRPYERCIKQGPEALSDEELLSVIIRTGSRKANSLETARQILRLNYPQDGILGLCHLTLPELKEVEGIGDVRHPASVHRGIVPADQQKICHVGDHPVPEPGRSGELLYGRDAPHGAGAASCDADR